MATAVRTSSFQTGHQEMIHDAQLDYYGKRLATASAGQNINIFDVSPLKSGGAAIPLASLQGHTGPVWQVAWGHPKFGSLLASCSYDGSVIIWKEAKAGQWSQIHKEASQASVNAVAWAPHTFGRALAIARSDGTVTVLGFAENRWTPLQTWTAHKGGVNGVSWGPEGQSVQQFVTGGCDNLVKLWAFKNNTWEEQRLHGDDSHKEWVRDVSWAPGLGMSTNTIASCSEDKTVKIWKQDGQNGRWYAQTLQFDYKVWRVSWSVSGNILAVSQGDNTVSLWKEAVDGKWRSLTSIQDQPAQNDSNNAPAPF